MSVKAASSTDSSHEREPPLTVRVAESADDLDGAWDRLDHGVSPFLARGFLSALERSGSIDPPRRSSLLSRGGRSNSGWRPAYVLVEQAGHLLAGAASFVKTHSYGEYIFDFGWANAAMRAGLRYYPKLVVAAPGTPATGPRLLLAPGLEAARREQVIDALVTGVQAVADAAECSSIHWLFCTQQEQAELARRGYVPRLTLQFHWHNRNYGSFDDFLAAMRSRRRKQLRKERARARAQIGEVQWLAGHELDTSALDDLDRWYRNTTDNHGGRAYMRPGFFPEVARALPSSLQLLTVEREQRRIAGALFFLGQRHGDPAGAGTGGALYGRYWGSDEPVEFLHFEAAYYAGIDRCIAKGLPLFEAGAQGEHKLLRGFEPARTYSAHWLRHPGLAEAVSGHCAAEAAAMDEQMAELAKLGPYHHDGADD